MRIIQCKTCEGKAKFVCSHCSFVGYCNVECQKLDWVNHQRLCHQPDNLWRPDDIGPFYIQKLWAITETTPSQDVPTSKLWFILDGLFWSSWEGPENLTEPEKELSPRQVIENPNISLYHWNAILNADLKYPILVVWPENEKYPIDVLDGLHRLAKTYIQKQKTIRVKKVTQADVEYARKNSY